MRPLLLLLAACAFAACDGTINFSTPEVTPPAGPLVGAYGAELRMGRDPLVVDTGGFCPVDPSGTPLPCPPPGPRLDTTVFAYDLRLEADGDAQHGRFLVERTATRFSNETPGEPIGIDEAVFEGAFRASGDTVWFGDDAPLFFRAYRDSLVLRPWPFEPPSGDGPLDTLVVAVPINEGHTCHPWGRTQTLSTCSGTFYRRARP